MTGFPRQRDVEKIVRAAIAAGVKVASVECSDGKIRVVAQGDDAIPDPQRIANEGLAAWLREHDAAGRP